MKNNLDQKAIDTIRVLSVEQINEANSGHPGIALGAAPLIHTLYTYNMNVNPENADWFNRDRFILSAGHGSSMLYAMLHLAGYGVSIDDLKQFRSLGSITPGHPESDITPGVDASTGPLGQGIAMATGMAVAEEFLAAKYNRDDLNLIDHYTYVICGDGDLQEGVALEALSLAGHLGLEKLIILYDSNDIQLDTAVNKTNTDNVKLKMEAMNWDYQLVTDGNSVEAIDLAIKKAREVKGKPSLIEVKTVIGYGSITAGTSKAHGAPLATEEVEGFRRQLGGDPFTVDTDIYSLYYDNITLRGRREFADWQNKLSIYQLKYPELYEELTSVIADEIEVDFNVEELLFDSNYKAATRVSNGLVLAYANKLHPTMIGGSADLSSSTRVKGVDGDFSIENRTGRNINFGVREHAMAAICNGMALHQGVKPFCGGFLVFVDYMKPAMRLSALMNLPVIYMFTHDSIAVGEDGPTHQPIEQISSLRTIPNFNVFRPADANEVKSVWDYLINHNTKKNPAAIILTRQDLPTITNATTKSISLGAYIASHEQNHLDGILIATGSELSLAIDAQKALLKEGIDVRVISMPSTNLFDKQITAYKEQLMPSYVTKRIALEMTEGSTLEKYVGLFGKVHNVNTFGKSCPSKLLVDEYGFNVDKVVEEFKKLPDIEIKRIVK